MSDSYERVRAQKNSKQTQAKAGQAGTISALL